MEYKKKALPSSDGGRACLMIARWFVTGFGVGFLPRASGTAGSLLGVLFFLSIQSVPRPYDLLFLTLLFVLSSYVITFSLPFFQRKDPREIVIDEIWAILVIFFMIPASFVSWTVGFILFRIFDIAKPSPIRALERLPGGWGVMADDFMAAIYTIAIVKILSPL